MASRIFAGAMSGTSADGVDVALVAIDGRGLDMSARLIHHEALPYDAELRRRIFALRSTGATSLSALAELAREIAMSYVRAVNAAFVGAGVKSTEVAAIAAHGQTLYHAPPLTLQWIDPALLAAETGCTVVSDFRRADCAEGGQGAPLVPFADYILFRDRKKSRVLLNIGGIANLTYLSASGSPEDVIAFDTGPGNCISDALCRSANPASPGFDAGGAVALRGKPVQAIVERFLDSDYFSQAPPKSTDGPSMLELFDVAQRSAPAELDDLLATACLCTALSIQRSIARFLPALPDEIVISGGGAENGAIVQYLARDFAPTIRWSDAFGIPSAAKEAVAFALLGAATLDGLPGNIPSATGARSRVVLGAITPKPR